MATCARDGVPRATPASTPLRLTQAGARHRERAEPVVFFPSSPLTSATAMLSSSPSPPVSPPSTTVDAASVASAPFSSHRLRPCLLAIVQPLLPSASTGLLPPPPLHLSLSPLSQPSTVVTFLRCLCSFFPFSSAPTVSPSTSSLTVDFPCQHHRHLPPLRPPSTSAPFSLFLCHHRRSLLSPSSSFRGHPPVSSSSRHRPIHLLLLSTSNYYLDHRRRLPSLFLSSAPPSASRPPSLSHRPLPLLSLFALSLSPSFTPVAPLPLPLHLLLRFDLCPSAPVTKTEHHRRPCSLHRRSPLPPPSSFPLCCRAPLPLPCFSTPATITLLSGPSTVYKLPLPCFSISEHRQPPPSTPSLFLFSVHPPSTSPIVVVSALSWTSSVTTSCHCQRRRRRHFPLPAPR